MARRMFPANPLIPAGVPLPAQSAGGDGGVFWWPPPLTGQTWPPPAPFFDYPTASASGSGRSGMNRTAILTPVIVAAAALIGSAFLLVAYYRVFAKYCAALQQLWGFRRSEDGGGGRGVAAGELATDEAALLQFGAGASAGLDEATVSKIPVYVFMPGEGVIGSSSCHECAVCLGEFEAEDRLRLLPKCGHPFHLACIDTWLRSHSNCPLCRAPIVAALQSGAERLEVDLRDEQRRTVDEQQQQQDLQLESQQQQDLQLELQQQQQHSQDEESQRQDHEQNGSCRSNNRRLGRSASSRPEECGRAEGILRRCYSLGPEYAPRFEPGAEVKLPEDDDAGAFVTINIEIASSSSSSSSAPSSSASSSSTSSAQSSRSPLAAAIHKSASLKESLRRSISAGGRVFSLRSIGRAKSGLQV